jgi:hypothetical protein
MPTWPATLPEKPIINGSSVEDETNVIGSSADVGIGQARRRYTGQGQFATYSFRMTQTQLEAFDDWFHDDATGLAGGVLPYTWEDPVLEENRTFQIVPGTRPRKTPARGKRTILSLQLYRHPA